MHNLKDHRVKAFLLFALLYWGAALFVIEYLGNIAAREAIKDHRNALQSDIAISRSKIEATIYEDIYIADALSLILEYDPTIVEREWETLARQFIQKSTHTRNIGVAPEDVIRYIYPLEGNEAAIGLNFRKVPHQYAAVAKAQELQSVYLDGPLELVQGGQAIIARYPIFLDRPINQRYWGTVSVVLNFDQIIFSSNLNEIQYADIALTRTNLDGEQQLIYGDLKAFEEADVLLPIHLPNTQWQLASKLHYWDLPEVRQAENITKLFALIGAIVLFLSIYILFRAYRVAHKISLLDDLTHLPNRRFFFNKLAKRIKKSKSDGPFVILNIDVNGFKTINDQLGHDTGDDLLRYLAKHLKLSLDSCDTVARIGGDEFVIILDKADNQQASKKAIQRIHHAIDENIFHWKKESLYISLSIGSALYRGQSEDELLAEADMDMYQQKQEHKTRSAKSDSDFVI
ncbi:Diguanylate cyclase DosC [Marinomonas aquimarina]|uniref:Diguanylate cyclase DosC n=1 Tax=Marinomonas aquimarina TaxID=295068 RepID=A0A1A8T7M4_9GAMM|nr:diguanylate cyclase [Marinomonas aquimarina]SBS27188.1 Diguanylate cyclase DosC [Marinomonas aquimarina]